MLNLCKNSKRDYYISRASVEIAFEYFCVNRTSARIWANVNNVFRACISLFLTLSMMLPDDSIHLARDGEAKE